VSSPPAFRPALSRRARFIPASLLPGLLVACASPAPTSPTSESPLALPSAWTVAASAASASATDSAAPAALDRPALARWWQQFDDPLLVALIDDALQGNTDLAVARARLDQARALRDSQAAGASPQLGSSAGLSRSHTRSTGGISSWQAGLDASWEPDFFGAQSSALRGRELDVAASAADLATTRMTVAAEVGIAYATLRGSRAQWRIARDNLAAQEQTLALTRWRAQAGLASTLDAEQARLSTEQLRANLPALEASIAQSEHRLAVLLGLPPAALRERLGSDDRLPASARDLPAGVPAELLRQRPDVRAAELAILAETERLTQRHAQRWPSFRLSGSLALKAATLSGLGGAGALVSSVAAAVDWPIWDGGTRRAAIDQQRAVLAQAQASYRAAVLTALEDVENALSSLGATRAQLNSLGEAHNAAQNALLLARQRWQAGLIDFGTLLDAQRSALSADNSLASARTNERLNLIRLYKALGGGWEEAGTCPGGPGPRRLCPEHLNPP
jgi:multidrug efflux system outer membrane protein